jgi:hypothetical protein
MRNNTATRNVTTIDSKKSLTKQELIAANIKLLIERLAAGKSEALTDYPHGHEPEVSTTSKTDQTSTYALASGRH